MSLKCGIVGLPNVGKSTLFNALTKAGIAAENYPFCTIEPNVGIVEVPDQRVAALAAIVKPQRVQNAIVEFVDIAGLVAGATPNRPAPAATRRHSASPPCWRSHAPSSTRASRCAASICRKRNGRR